MKRVDISNPVKFFSQLVAKKCYLLFFNIVNGEYNVGYMKKLFFMGLVLRKFVRGEDIKIRKFIKTKVVRRGEKFGNCIIINFGALKHLILKASSLIL